MNLFILSSFCLLTIGFVPDIRNHPALNYYKSGIPIVIAGDDPGSFGYNELTVDYYMAFMSWGINLYDLREIANNSIKYSSITEATRQEGFAKFTAQWSKFVDHMYGHICNNAIISSNQNQINITNFFPSYGPNDASIDMVVYGSGFENFLCKELTCYFNEVETRGVLNKFNELVCATPKGFSANEIARVAIGYGNITFNTSMTYRFIAAKSINILYDDSFSSGTCVQKSLVLSIISFFFNFFKILFL